MVSKHIIIKSKKSPEDISAELLKAFKNHNLPNYAANIDDKGFSMMRVGSYAISLMFQKLIIEGKFEKTKKGTTINITTNFSSKTIIIIAMLTIGNSVALWVIISNLLSPFSTKVYALLAVILWIVVVAINFWDANRKFRNEINNYF